MNRAPVFGRGRIWARSQTIRCRDAGIEVAEWAVENGNRRHDDEFRKAADGARNRSVREVQKALSLLDARMKLWVEADADKCKASVRIAIRPSSARRREALVA